jgi:hypothetical protein
MTVPPIDPLPPRDRWYRRYWGTYNRPYRGCGCLYLLILFLATYFLLSLLFEALTFWYWW